MARYPVSISFDQKELRQLDRFARRLHQTRSTFLKIALAEYIQKIRFESLRRAGEALARSKGYFTDDDIFRAVS